MRGFDSLPRLMGKEKYIPVEPVKKGIEVTGFLGKKTLEIVYPRIKNRLVRGIARRLQSI